MANQVATVVGFDRGGDGRGGGARLIRGPTHVTQTDVWVSRGDTLSLFKRRGNPCSGNRAGGNSSKIACRCRSPLC